MRIIFLGTAGARVMVSKQLLSSGGIWLSIGAEILLDPGPGTIVHASKKKLSPEKLDAIVLSHKHLDHSSDVNVMIEAMTEGGFKKRGILICPRDAIENDPVVLLYLRDFLEKIEVMEEGKSYEVKNVKIHTPLRHIHPVETYGVIFETKNITISYISDTKFFDKLLSSYYGDILIINVVRAKPGGPFDHLSAPEASEIIKAVKPKKAILTHFGMTMWRKKPWEVARKISEETGTEVIAARDGMTIDLT